MEICWPIVGIGFNTESIPKEKINCEKLARAVIKKHEEKRLDIWKAYKEGEEPLLEMAKDLSDFYGLSEYMIGDLWEEGFTVESGGNNGGDYLLFPARLPWNMPEKAPSDPATVLMKLVRAMQTITDCKDSEAIGLIDPELHEVGCG